MTVALDCTDTFAVRDLLNRAAWRAGVPVVSGAAIRWEGQVTTFDPNDPGSPCYACLYPEDAPGALNCAENGVIAPLVGVIGAHQALEAIKIVTGVGSGLVGRILVYEAKYAEWRSLKLPPQPDCPVCGGTARR